MQTLEKKFTQEILVRQFFAKQDALQLKILKTLGVTVAVSNGVVIAHCPSKHSVKLVRSISQQLKPVLLSSD